MAQERQDERHGKDLPNADGQVSDEAMQDVRGERDDKPTGQDHSLDDYADTMPEEGVGAVQDNSTIKGDVADINE